RDEFSQQTLDEVSAQEAAREQLAEVETALEEVLEVTDVPITAEIRADARGLVVSISTDHVLFEVGAAEISAAGRQLIAEIAPVLVGAPNSVVIEGHTDDTPIVRSRWGTNLRLSVERAMSVADHLIAAGLPANKVSAAGYGPNRPAVEGTTDEARMKNRRVEILLIER
ncbi:MAG: OmpA family protein, partial [Planctomycetes bacterium]|nr:OmpA family protein [Planctomycetota bacterium]